MPATDPFAIEVGDRIKLIAMPDDPDPVPAGSEGVVVMVSDIGFRQKKEVQLAVQWDNGRKLCCICPPDIVEVLKENGNEAGDSGKVD